MLAVCQSPAALEEEIHLAKQAEKLGLEVKVMNASGIQSFDTGTELRAQVVFGMQPMPIFIPAS